MYKSFKYEVNQLLQQVDHEEAGEHQDFSNRQARVWK